MLFTDRCTFALAHCSVTLYGLAECKIFLVACSAEVISLFRAESSLSRSEIGFNKLWREIHLRLEKGFTLLESRFPSLERRVASTETRKPFQGKRSMVKRTDARGRKEKFSIERGK